MSKFAYDRLFGSDIRKNLRNKLRARQNLNQGVNFGDSLYNQMVYGWDETNPDINASSFGGQAELGSRTPWARIWTVIEQYKLDCYSDEIKEIYNSCDENTSQPITTSSDCFTVLTKAAQCDPQKFHDTTGVGSANIKNMNTNVWVIGDNAYTDYHQNTSIGDNRGTFLSENSYLTPNVGITSVTSEHVQDGLAVESVISLKVFNYADFENIIFPYFMVTGAKIFIDMGWDTADSYDPAEFIVSESGEFMFNEFYECIYGYTCGSDENKTAGKMYGSNGDLEVLSGVVTKFDVNVNDDGSWEVQLTLMSQNWALVDYNQKTAAPFSHILDSNIEKTIFDYIVQESGINPENLTASDYSSNDELKELTPLYTGPSRKYYYRPVGDDEPFETGPMFPVMDPNTYKIGVYTPMKNGTVISDFGEYKSTPGKAFEEFEKVTQTRHFITFWYFEKILNEFLGLVMEQSSENSDEPADDSDNDKLSSSNGDDEDTNVTAGSWATSVNLYQTSNDLKRYSSYKGHVKFNVRNSSVRFNEFLYMRQLYESMTGYSSNHSTIYPTNAYQFWKDSGTVLSNGVPLHQMWLNVDIIKKQFVGEVGGDNFREGIKNLLKSINEDSHGILNLRLRSNYAGTELEIVDETENSNQDVEEIYNSKEALVDDPNDTIPFTFVTHSPNTIASEVNLNFALGNTDLANKIAVEGMTVDKQLYPVSTKLKEDMVMRSMKNQTLPTPNVFYRWLPAYLDPGDKYIANQIQYYKTSNVEDKVEGAEDASVSEARNSEMQTLLASAQSRLVTKAVSTDDLNQQEDEENITQSDSTSTDSNVSSMDYKFPKILEVTTPNEYFAWKIRGQDIALSSESIILPFNVSLGVYGIAGLTIGNRFKVDYIFDRYQEKVHFIISKISHEISQGKWITKFDGQMRYDVNSVSNDTILYQPEVRMSTSALIRLGYDLETAKALNAGDEDEEFFNVAPIAYIISSGTCPDPNSLNYKSADDLGVQALTDCRGSRKGLDSYGDISCCQYCSIADCNKSELASEPGFTSCSGDLSPKIQDNLGPDATLKKENGKYYCVDEQYLNTGMIGQTDKTITKEFEINQESILEPSFLLEDRDNIGDPEDGSTYIAPAEPGEEPIYLDVQYYCPDFYAINASEECDEDPLEGCCDPEAFDCRPSLDTCAYVDGCIDPRAMNYLAQDHSGEIMENHLPWNKFPDNIPDNGRPKILSADGVTVNIDLWEEAGGTICDLDLSIVAPHWTTKGNQKVGSFDGGGWQGLTRKDGTVSMCSGGWQGVQDAGINDETRELFYDCPNGWWRPDVPFDCDKEQSDRDSWITNCLQTKLNIMNRHAFQALGSGDHPSDISFDSDDSIINAQDYSQQYKPCLAITTQASINGDIYPYEYAEPGYQTLGYSGRVDWNHSAELPPSAYGETSIVQNTTQCYYQGCANPSAINYDPKNTHDCAGDIISEDPWDPNDDSCCTFMICGSLWASNLGEFCDCKRDWKKTDGRYSHQGANWWSFNYGYGYGGCTYQSSQNTLNGHQTKAFHYGSDTSDDYFLTTREYEIRGWYGHESDKWTTHYRGINPGELWMNPFNLSEPSDINFQHYMCRYDTAQAGGDWALNESCCCRYDIGHICGVGANKTGPAYEDYFEKCETYGDNISDSWPYNCNWLPNVGWENGSYSQASDDQACNTDFCTFEWDYACYQKQDTCLMPEKYMKGGTVSGGWRDPGLYGIAPGIPTRNTQTGRNSYWKNSYGHNCSPYASGNDWCGKNGEC